MTTKETRLVGEAGQNDQVAAPIWTPAYGLRLRRAASHRLTPLDCGHRDPYDCRRHDVWPEPYDGDYWAEVGANLTMAELASAGQVTA